MKVGYITGRWNVSKISSPSSFSSLLNTLELELKLPSILKKIFSTFESWLYHRTLKHFQSQFLVIFSSDNRIRSSISSSSSVISSIYCPSQEIHCSWWLGSWDFARLNGANARKTARGYLLIRWFRVARRRAGCCRAGAFDSATRRARPSPLTRIQYP